MDKVKRKFVFSGAVYDSYNRLIAPRWHGTTWAVSYKKAISQLKHQFRMQLGYGPKNKLQFEGTIKEMQNGYQE